MANMSYCRFQNTLGDLRDCYDALNDEDADSLDEMDDDEKSARSRLIKLCGKIFRDFEEEVDE